MMIGTLVNAGAVLAGGSLGLIVHRRLPERHKTIAFQGLGLVTLMLGLSMALRTSNPVILILSILVGSLLGESLRLETYLEASVERVRLRFARNSDSRFTEGAITAFMMFCMGSMTIIGALEDGMGKGADLLFAKSVLDGFAGLAFAATFGVGVLFSVVPLLVYQGAWTLAGIFLGNLLPDSVTAELSAVGGVILIGLGLNILELKKIPLLNMLPALLMAILLSLLWPLLGMHG